MILFIRNVPKSLSRKELRNAVQEILKPRVRLPFFRVFAVTKAQFLSIHDKDIGITERHGLVTLHPGNKGDARLRRIRHVRLRGRLCPVRPYVKRRAQRDHLGFEAAALDSLYDHPAHDRRRRDIDIEIERQPYVQGLNIGSTLERNQA